MDLSQIERNTVSLLRYALDPQGEPAVLSAPWADVEKELLSQTVAYLPADITDRLGLTAPEKARYTVACAANLRKFHQVLQTQTQLETLLPGIPFVVLKGAAAAVYYPAPERRQMGDVDILVHPSDLETSVRLLEAAGYSRYAENARHVSLRTPSGIFVEVHRKFSSSNDAAQNAVLDALLDAAVDRRERREVCGYSVPMLPAPENGLVLLGHINEHLSSGLGLRQIVDWMMFARENLSDEFWQQTFCPLAESIGLRRLAETVTLLCKNHLGLQGCSWCDGADASLADELLEFLFEKGNFGRKHRDSSRTITVMHSFRNPLAAIRYLTAGGMVHWQAAQKHKFLRPFAWLYQIGHLLRMGLKRKVRFSIFWRELRQSRDEADLLQRLNVTRK